MKPTKFEGSNVTFAKDQPQYLQLPAYRYEDGTVITEWEFSDEERARIAKGENLRISILTFNKALQPFTPYLPSMPVIAFAAHHPPFMGGETHDQALQE